MKKTIALITLLVLLLTSTLCFAGEGDDVAIMTDTVALRPLGIAAIAAGTAVFIVSLPFALITHGTKKTAQTFVTAPFNYTFHRPLGDFYTPEEYTQTPAQEYSAEGEEVVEMP